MKVNKSQRGSIMVMDGPCTSQRVHAGHAVSKRVIGGS